MTLTIDELKERYYKVVLEKGSEIYSFWCKNKTKSKRIVTKANEYAFDKRLKSNEKVRFYALTFAYALGLRLEKRYRRFLCKLLRLFAFIRERKALRILKKVLGFSFYTDMRTIIEAEVGNLSVILSSSENQETTGGGKGYGKGEIPIEESIQDFIEECMQEDVQDEIKNDMNDDNIELLEKKGDVIIENKDNKDREKISVKETEQSEKSIEEKEDISQKEKNGQIKKEQINKNQTQKEESKKEEKSTQKSVANTSIIAEKMIAEQERLKEPSSTFPVFRETKRGNSAIEKSDDGVKTKEQNEIKFDKEEIEGFDSNMRDQNKQNDSPFPVFRPENGNLEKGNEKPIEKPKEKTGEKVNEWKFENSAGKLSEKMIEQNEMESKEILIYEKMDISEENRMRIKLNIKMNKAQIEKIAEQIKEAAKIEMEQEERAWREQNSVPNEGKTMQSSLKPVSDSQSGGIVKGSKK